WYGKSVVNPYLTLSKVDSIISGRALKQSLGGLDLAVLKAQSLFFEQPKQLFDNPSRPIPIDDLPGGIGIGDRMGGEQPPGNRLAPLWRVGLAQFDQAQPDLLWQLRGAGIARPGDRDDPKAQLQPSLALGPTRTFAQRHPTGAGQRRLTGDLGQAAAADQASIVVNSAQHVDTRFRHQRPQGVKIG